MHGSVSDLASLTRHFVRVSRETCSRELIASLPDFEEVHSILDEKDLNRRLGSIGSGFENRRSVFAFLDPDDSNVPLIFFEAAFELGTNKNVRDILSGGDHFRGRPDTVVPYSISNCKNSKTKGVRGLGLALILRTREVLNRTHRHITNLVTTSPVPQLTRWVSEDLNQTFLEKHDPRGLVTLSVRDFKELAVQSSEEFARNDEHIHEQTRRLGAMFVMFVRRGHAFNFDPVAEFHLGNGARLDDICPNANTPSKFSQSWGLMANYRYPAEQARIRNAENLTEARRPDCSTEVWNLLRGPSIRA